MTSSMNKILQMNKMMDGWMDTN